MVNKIKAYLDAVAEDYHTLAEHDRIYHPGGYRDGDECKVRDKMAKSDNPDEMVAKAGVMEARTKNREAVKGILEEMLGGHVRFTGDEGKPSSGRNEVNFVIDSGRPNHWGASGMSIIEDDLAKRGFVARITEGSHSWRDPGKSFSGSIRPMTSAEKFARTKMERPQADEDGWMVDGEEYEDLDQANLAWKAAMKKYGAEAKGAFRQEGSRDGDRRRVRGQLEKKEGPGKVSAAEKGEPKDVLGEVEKRAKDYLSFKESFRRRHSYDDGNGRFEEQNRRYEQMHGGGGAYEELEKVRDKALSALSDTPWSTFGKDDKEQLSGLEAFDGKLPEDTNLDTLMWESITDLDEDGFNHWDAETLWEKFCESKRKEDKTIGDTMKRAIPAIERFLNGLGDGDRGYRAGDDDAWSGERAKRDAYRQDAPLSASARGW